MEIDPVKYGVLWQRVQDSDRRLSEMSRKIDKMDADLEKLLALANQAKGSVYAGRMVSGMLGGAIAVAMDWLFRK